MTMNGLRLHEAGGPILGRVLLLAAALLAGCSLGQRDGEGRTTVVLGGWGNLAEVQMYRQLIDEFEKANPDLQVKFMHIRGNYDAVLMTMIAGGNAPDVFLISPSRLGDLLSKQVLRDLDPFIARSTIIRTDDFFPQTVEPYRWDGNRFGQGPIYGLCKDWSPDWLVFYNKKLFDEAGIPYPDGSWTREEFVEIAKKLTKRDERDRIVQFGVYNNCSPEQWVWQSGGRYFSDDGRRCTLDRPEALEAMEFSNNLSNKWHVAPGYAEQQQGAVDVMFQTGRVAMCFYGQWFVPQFRDNIKDFKWGVTTPPRHRSDVYVCGGMCGYGMYARAPHPEAAWRLMEFLVGPRGQEVCATIGWNIPSNRNVARSPVFRENPGLDRGITETFLAAAEKTRLFQTNPYINYGELQLRLSPHLELMALGEIPPAEALRRAVGDINQAIEDNLAILAEEAGKSE
jgi:multiple sugar transport system substrate-binding protein